MVVMGVLGRQSGALTKAEPGKYGCVFCSQVWYVQLPHGRPISVLTFAWVELRRERQTHE